MGEQTSPRRFCNTGNRGGVCWGWGDWGGKSSRDKGRESSRKEDMNYDCGTKKRVVDSCPIGIGRLGGQSGQANVALPKPKIAE